MRGGLARPNSFPMRRIFAVSVPTTLASRSMGTSCQLRQMKACRRSGKCGKTSAGGAPPWGSSDANICAALDVEKLFLSAKTARLPPASPPRDRGGLEKIPAAEFQERCEQILHFHWSRRDQLQLPPLR